MSKDKQGQREPLQVGKRGAGQRLDNFLARELKGVPKGHIYRLIRTGQVRVNGSRSKPVTRLEAGDEVRIPPVRTSRGKAVDVPPKVIERVRHSVVAQGKGWLAVNKPSGLVVHGGSGLSFGLIEAARLAFEDDDWDLVHRLDRETSGCLLLSRDRPTLQHLQQVFRRHQTRKYYMLLVAGDWKQGDLDCRLPLDTRNREDGERHVVVSEQGKGAHTGFRVLERYRNATLMEAELHTGRTHQIRVHAAELGHPIIGDQRYGDARANTHFAEKHNLRRLCLHSHMIAMPMPDGSEAIANAPLDDTLRESIDELPRR